MADYSRAKRVLIAERRFVQSLQFKHIAEQVDGITANGARMLCRRLQKQYPEATPAELVEHAMVTNRRGTAPRIKAGSRDSLYIRDKLRTDYRKFDQHEAANWAFQQLHAEPKPNHSDPMYSNRFSV